MGGDRHKGDLAKDPSRSFRIMAGKASVVAAVSPLVSLLKHTVVNTPRVVV
jgi:hypothetical protein